MLIALLSMKKLSKLSPFLRSLKDEIIEPLLKHDSLDVQWRVLKCLSLFALLDQQVATDSIKLLCAPVSIPFYLRFPSKITSPLFQIMIYHTSSMCHAKQCLIVSISAVTDIFRLFGGIMFKGNEESEEGPQNSTMVTNKSVRRKLYRVSVQPADMTMDDIRCEDFIDTLMEMLDDEVTPL